MAADPFFSIVTPTLNAEHYLGACLVSLASQGVALEHVVVDGGSTDGTESLVRGAGSIWLSAPGLKQAAAINRGMGLARGQLVAWLNADDLYLPGTLACVGARLLEHPEVDVVIGNCDLIAADGHRLRHLRPGPYDFWRLLQRGNYIPQPAVFWRRGVGDRVGALDETLEYAMDYDFWLRFRELQVEWVDLTLAQFRWHQRSKSARGQARAWQENLRVMRRYGGGWNARLRWAFARARLSLAKDQAASALAALLWHQHPT